MNFVYHLIKNKPHMGPKAEAFFQDIESQKFLGVTTTFTISFIHYGFSFYKKIVKTNLI